MTEESDTFKANYAILKEVAETLRTQKEPDIDVDQALAAYKVCKDRLTAVKAAFGERLPEDIPE